MADEVEQPFTDKEQQRFHLLREALCMLDGGPEALEKFGGFSVAMLRVTYEGRPEAAVVVVQRAGATDEVLMTPLALLISEEMMEKIEGPDTAVATTDEEGGD